VNTAKVNRIGTLIKGTPREKGNGEFEFEFTLSPRKAYFEYFCIEKVGLVNEMNSPFTK